MPTLSSEIESTEKSLNQRNPILLIILLRIVPTNNSTIFALMQITEKIKGSIDKGKFGCGIFIDLRKAFDTVNHDILSLN